MVGRPSAVASAQEVVGELGDVVEPLAQRRQADRHDVQAIEQILAEQALLDQPAQVAMGGGDDADVGLDRRAAADRHVLAFLQHAQQPGLRLGRHVADLVEEQRAAVRLLELAGRALDRAGEGAALVAEQLALDQLARDRRHVERHERALAALAVVVQRARHQLLAGAGLAGDHHREVGRHQAGERAVDLLHRRRAADQRQALALLRRMRARGTEAAGADSARFDDRDQLVEVERLGQVFERAALGRRAPRSAGSTARS